MPFIKKNKNITNYLFSFNSLSKNFFRLTLVFLSVINYSVFSYAETKNGTSPQVLSLPSGPGSIEGLGEAFEPQLNSGTVSYSIPLKTPPGRAGLQPSISLSYNGGNPNGIVGLGWKLAVPMIRVRTEDGFPVYDESDAYIGVDGEELVEIETSVFRSEIEGVFNRYEKLSDGWKVKNKSGLTSFYGTDALSRISDSLDNRIYAWCLKKQIDLNGNEVNFIYESIDDSNQRYLTEVRYSQIGENFQSVHFVYEKRPDSLTDYRSGFPVSNGFRLDNIAMKSSGQLVRRYDLKYSEDANISLLSSVQEFGSDGLTSLPQVTMNYTSLGINTQTLYTIEQAEGVILSANPDYGLNDMNADGLPDLLVAEPGDHRVYQNMGLQADSQTWNSPVSLQGSPSYALGSSGVSLADIDADGKTDLVAQLSNFDYLLFKNKGDMNWEAPIAFSDKTGLPIDFESATVRLVDINNDKYTDVMLTEDGSASFYSYYINDKGTGYSRVLTKEGLGDAMTFDQRPEMLLSDMNGDNVQDIVLLGNDYLRYWPGMGNGEWDKRKLGNWNENEVGTGVRMFNPPSSLDEDLAILEFSYDQLKPIDVNGDGLTDLLFQPQYANYLFYWLNLDGLNWSEPIRIENVPVATDLTTLLIADMNGNGTIDLLWNYSESAESDVSLTWQYLDFYPDEKPYLLKSVSNGIGKTTGFTYGSSVDEFLRDQSIEGWVNRVPNPVNILKQLDVNDGLNNYTTIFNYHDGYYDAAEKEFRGFAKAEQFELGDSSIPTLESAYEFHLGLTHDALKGKPKIMVQRDANGSYFNEIYQWDVRQLVNEISSGNKTVSIAYQTQKDKTINEQGNGTPVTLRWQFDYDDYGNQIKVIEYGRLDLGWEDERTTESAFSASCETALDDWLLDRPISNIVRKGVSGLGVKVSENQYFYDGNTNKCELSRGLLTETKNWVEDSKYISTVRKAYDSYGNPTHLYDPLYTSDGNGHYREIIYDETFFTFPIQEKIIVNSVRTLSMSAQYDFGFGTVLSSVGLNNHTTSYGYDVFGRLSSITKPLDTQTSVEYDYVLAHPIGNGQTINWVETRQRESVNGGTVDSRKFYDGLSRLVMTRSEGETAGQIVVSDTVQFNARKTAAKNYLPYFETGTLDYQAPSFATSFTTHTYDALGREIKMAQPDGSYSETLFEPLIKIIKDEEQTKPQSSHFGAAMRYEEDGLLNKDGAGRLRKVTELMPEPWITQYRYDVLDNLTGYTDSQGNQKHIEYDGLSRKTFMNDPDRGHMNYSYDDASNLTQAVDAKQQTIDYTYDGVNRLLTEAYQGNATPSVTYHYDAAYGPVSPGQLYGSDVPQSYIADLLAGQNPGQGADVNNDGIFDVADIVKLSKTETATLVAENTLGQLAWVEDEAGEEHYSYDERARKTWTIRQIEDGSNTQNYYTGMEYDSMDRVTRLSYPDRSYVDYEFNRRGFLESVPNIINAYDYNPSGQNKDLTLNNGINTVYTYDNRLRLASLKTTRNTNNLSLQHLTYSYDAVSNITQIDDLRNTTTLTTIGTELGLNNTEAQKYKAKQNFTYDNLYRLTQAKNDAVYGSITYAYDQIGNMTNKNAASLTTPDTLMDFGNMGYGGSAGAINRDGRAANDAPGPHAITSTTKGPNGQLEFTYDANGNLTSERGLSYQWDEKDRLTGMTKTGTTGTYRYDFNNSRKLKQVSDAQNNVQSTVHYVDKYSEVRDGKLIKYVYAGASRVARTSANNTSKQALIPETYYHHDHLGSTNLASATNGNVTEHLVNYPFGRSRLAVNINNTNKSDYRFTGKERDDETDLEYFEARYLGVAGQFISVDPKRINIDKESKWLKFSKNLNIYSYVNNNPLSSVDPQGKEPVSIILLTGVGIGIGYLASEGLDYLGSFTSAERGKSIASEASSLRSEISSKKETTNGFTGLATAMSLYTKALLLKAKVATTCFSSCKSALKESLGSGIEQSNNWADETNEKINDTKDDVMKEKSQSGATEKLREGIPQYLEPAQDKSSETMDTISNDLM